MDKEGLKKEAESYLEIVRKDSKSIQAWLNQKQAGIVQGGYNAMKSARKTKASAGQAATGTGSAAPGAISNGFDDSLSSLYERAADTARAIAKPSKAKVLAVLIFGSLVWLFIALMLQTSFINIFAGVAAIFAFIYAVWAAKVLFVADKRYVATVVYKDERGVVVNRGGKLEVMEEARGLKVDKGDNLIVVENEEGKKILSSKEYY